MAHRVTIAASCIVVVMCILRTAGSVEHQTPRWTPSSFPDTNDPPQGPVFISEPRSEIVFSNTEGITIPCTAYGRPAPVLDWVKANGSDVNEVPGLLELLPNNSLHFPPFSEDKFRVDVHTGHYRCVASNSGGTIVSRKVSVKAVLLDRYRTYNVRVNDIYVTQGNTGVFKYTIDPYYVRGHIHVISWTLNGSPITSGGRMSILSTGELMVQDVEVKDSYLPFRCVTRNVINGEEKQSDPATLFVIDPVNYAPQFEDLPREIHTTQMTNAELPCSASGYPHPSYTWARDGVVINTNQTRVRQNGGNLVIESVTIRDSGVYECRVHNSLGSTTRTVELVVSAPISAFIEPTFLTVDVGQSAVFNCTVFGYPVLEVQWYKNGRPIEADERVAIVTEHSLRISQVERMDRGMYQCMVWSAKDNTQASTQLAIGVAKPFLFGTFEDRTVPAGPGISLKCAASGNPTPTIQWTVDDSPLPLDTRYTLGSNVTKDGDVISYLNITSVKVEDGGQYHCVASNPAGSAQHIGRINVYGVPYIRPMHNVTAVANEILVLKCYVSGYPIESIIWRRGEEVLPVNHRQQTSRDGILTIHSINRDHDEGQYSCDARNSGGQGMRRSVSITVMEPPKIDPFRFPTGRKQGDRISVSCVVSSGDLPISIDWLWNRRPIPKDIGIVVQKMATYSSLLSISNANPRHNGNFTCTAANKVATVNHTATLHVNVPPSWVVEPADSFVILASSVILDCRTTGDPPPLIVWKKAIGSSPGSYQDIDTSMLADRKSRMQILANGSLVVKDAEVADEGHYLCHSSNGVGAGLSKVIHLTVHVPATFSHREHPTNYSVRLGDVITMESVANGDKPLSLSWSFNGGNLDWQYNGRLDVSYFNTQDGRGSRLVIKPTVRQDSGFYVCNAKNIFGSDSLAIYLTVLERPDPPKDVSVYTGNSRVVSVRWMPTYNGNSPVTTYLVQAKIDSDTWVGLNTMNITSPAGVSEATVRDLRPAFTYNFRVMSINDIGTSAPSDETSYTTQTEAPSGSPEGVKALATGSQTLVVTWMPPALEKQNGEIQGYYIGYNIHNSTAPFMYLTKTVDELLTTEEPLAADGSPLFRDWTASNQRLWMTIDNLEKFTQYAVHIQAYNDQGAGPRSNDIIVFTLEDVPSQPPQNVLATPLSSQSVKIMWGPPPLYTLHGILQGYKIFYKPVRADEDESDSISITTNELSAVICGLQKYTNYSVQVLAYTRKGEGVRCTPVYVRTQPDLPGRPADIQAVPAGSDSILVAWKAPLHPNGQILKYTLHMRDITDAKVDSLKHDLPASQLSHMVFNLSRHHEYGFRVGARTVVGNGELTYEYKVTTVDTAGARIASFSGEVYAHWHSTVSLHCQAVGQPTPSVTWRKRSEPIIYDDRIQLLQNGSLLVKDITGSDAANYTCRAENTHGADQMLVVLVVQVDQQQISPPKQPVITIAATTSSTIQVNWRSGSNGGSKIQGFYVNYKREHGHWIREKLVSAARSYTASELQCGSKYSFVVRAFNRVGDGTPSETITVKTNGSLPIMPAQSLILKHINSTFIQLDMSTWQSGGCPMTSYDIHYQYWGDSTWHLVQAHIDSQQTTYRVDLRPATWYIVRVTAFNEAGSTDCTLKFSTKTYEGNTIEPVRIVHHYQPRFYERAYIMVPLCVAFVLIVVLGVGVGLYFRRRERDFQYKTENASNIRKDLTTESFLMSDVDKPSNLATDHTYSPDPSSLPNNSTVVDHGGQSDFQDGRPSNQDRAGNISRSSCSTDDEGNIKPYATFPLQLDTPSKPLNTARDSGERDTTYHLELDPDLDKLPPPPLEMLQDQSHRGQPQTNGGVLLSPRPLVDIDPERYHGDGYHPSFRLSLFHLPSLRLNRNMVAPEKGRQRQSVVSNVSSNHDELAQVLGHLQETHPSIPTRPQKQTPYPVPRPVPLGSVTPDRVETPLREFTKSPARPNEHRRGVCEVPLYDSTGKGCTDHDTRMSDCPTPPPPPPPVPAKPTNIHRTLPHMLKAQWDATLHSPGGTLDSHSHTMDRSSGRSPRIISQHSNTLPKPQNTSTYHTEPDSIPSVSIQPTSRRATPDERQTLVATPNTLESGDLPKTRNIDRHYKSHTQDDDDELRQPLQGGYRV